MHEPWQMALCSLVVTSVVLRITRPFRNIWVRLGKWGVIIIFYTVGLVAIPELQEGFMQLLHAIEFLLVLPIILYGVMCGLAAPTFKGGKPPEFL